MTRRHSAGELPAVGKVPANQADTVTRELPREDERAVFARHVRRQKDVQTGPLGSAG